MNHVQVRAAAIKEHGRLSTLNNPPGARNYQDSLRLQGTQAKNWTTWIDAKNKNSREHREHVNPRIQQ